MIKRISIMLLSIVMIISFVGCSSGNGEKSVADVNGELITKDYFEKKFLIIEKSYNDYYNEDIWTEEYEGKTFRELVKTRLLDSLVIESLIKQSLDGDSFKLNSSEVQDALSTYNSEIDSNEDLKKFYADNEIDKDFIKKQIESQFYMEEMMNKLKEKVLNTPETLDKYYKENVIEVKASHILVKDELAGKEILEKIKAGGDFAELAKEYSQDESTAFKGGDLGFFPKNRTVPEIEGIAFSLEVGQVSDVFKSEFGYHILKVEDKRTIADLEAIEGMEEEVEKYKNAYVESVVKVEFDTMIEKMKSEAEIKIYENNIR